MSAVEAAAAQGRFGQIYQRMFETQVQWGEQRRPLDSVFRGFAADLGLDLGVQGTPTFFVDNTKINTNSYNDLAAALDSALA